MKIRILAGVYGHRESGRVKAVKAGDPPIEVDDANAARLIAAGVAEAVEEPKPKAAAQPEPEVETEEPDEGFPEFSEKMTRAELEAVAREVGLEEKEIKGAQNKGDLIDLLEQAKADYEAGADEPSFDPAGDML